MKKKIMMMAGLMTVIGVFSLKAAGAATDGQIVANLVKNSGFEEATELPKDHATCKTLRDLKWTFDEPSYMPNGWWLNVLGREGVYRLIRNKSAAHSGEAYVRVTSDLCCGTALPVSAGDVVTFSFWAKDPDASYADAREVSGVLYANGGDALRFNAVVGGAWRQCTGSIEIPEEISNMPVTSVSPVLRSPGGGSGACFDDVVVTITKGTAAGVKTGKKDFGLNGSFENWIRTDKTPDGWDLADGQFPDRWTVEGRPGGKGYLRRVLNAPDEKERLGNYSIFLDGRILSKFTFTQTTTMISFWARGKGGQVVCRVRYHGNSVDTVVRSLADVIREKTGDSWKEYSGLVTSYGGVERLELEGNGVLIANVKIQEGETVKETKEGMPPAVFTIPVIAKPPVVDGAGSPEEWRDAVGMKNGFMDIRTKALVSRQTEFALIASREKLYIRVKIDPRQNGVKNTIMDRDGNVWEDESLEVFINPTPEKAVSDVYQIIMNAGGVVFDQIHQKTIGQTQVGWNCNGLEVRTAGCEWEIGIPLAEVGIRPGSPFGLTLARNLLYPQEFATITGRGYSDFKNMFLCTLSEDAPSIAWEYGGNIKEGKLVLTAKLRNRGAVEKSWQASLTCGEKKETTTVKLAPAGSQNVILDAADTAMKNGPLSLTVTDASGKTIFAESLVINTECFIKNQSVEGPQKYRVEFLPVQKKIVLHVSNLADLKDVQLEKGNGKVEVSVYKDEGLVTRQTVNGWQVVKNTGSVSIPFAPTAPGSYMVRALVYNPHGNCVACISDTIENGAMPWLGNALGKDRVVIPPFTPLRVKGDTVSCWGRDYELAGNGLAQNMISQGEKVLTGTMRFSMDNGTGVEIGRPGNRVRWEEKAQDRAMFRGETAFSNVDVKLSGLMEYDGMVKYEMEIVPRKETEINRLSLEVPIRDMRYFHWTGYMRCPGNGWAMFLPKEGEYRDPNVIGWKPGDGYKEQAPITRYLPREDGLVWSSKGIENPGIYGNFLPYLMVGNEQYGVCWFADSDRGWSHDKDSTCFELVRKGDEVVLRVNFIAKRTVLKAPRKIVFGVMATPSRPRLTGGNQAVRIASMGFDNTFMNQAMAITFRDYYLAGKYREACRKESGALHIYLCNNLFPGNDEAAKLCRNEWANGGMYTDNLSALPRKYFGPNAEDYVCFGNCAISSRVDYQVYCIEKDLREGAIDGVYMDNSYPNPCNILHHENCGYIREDGNLQGGYHLFETRDLIKRVATIAYQLKIPPPAWSIHMTSALLVPCFSFAELNIDGEWGYGNKDFMDVFGYPYLEGFGAGAWGGNPGWLPELGYGELAAQIKPTRTLLAGLKVYDMWLWQTGMNMSLWYKIEAIDRKFGIASPDCRFVGCGQKDARAVAGLPVGVKAGFYVRPGKGALIYVSNFNLKKQATTCRLDFRKWDLGDFKAVDAETGKEIALTAGTLPMEIEGHDFRLIRLEKKQ